MSSIFFFFPLSKWFLIIRLRRGKISTTVYFSSPVILLTVSLLTNNLEKAFLFQITLKKNINLYLMQIRRNDKALKWLRYVVNYKKTKTVKGYLQRVVVFWMYTIILFHIIIFLNLYPTIFTSKTTLKLEMKLFNNNSFWKLYLYPLRTPLRDITKLRKNSAYIFIIH